MEQILEDKKNGYPDTLKKLRSKYDFDELKKDSVAKAYLDFNVGSWVVDGQDKLLTDRPREVEGHLRRGGQGQGGEGRRGRHQERRQRDGLISTVGDPHRRSHPLARSLRPLPRQPHDRPGRDDRERRAAVDQAGPRVLGDLAGVGGQRVPADLWRPAAARRAPRRPARASPDVHLRDHAVHAQLAGVRPVELAGDARRRARRAGCRRRGRLGGVALADHGPLHRDRRAREGDGVLRLRRVRRRDRSACCSAGCSRTR